MVLGDLNGLLKGERVLDKGSDEARDDVPLNVAVEEPDACSRLEFDILHSKRGSHRGCRP